MAAIKPGKIKVDVDSAFSKIEIILIISAITKVKSIYHFTENLFEKFSTFTLKVFSNSITFIFAVALVIFWFTIYGHSLNNLKELIRDIILSITFLSFFIIQKTQNRLSAATHLKLNELVKAQENASNKLLNAEKKSEAELSELEKKFEDTGEETSQNP